MQKILQQIKKRSPNQIYFFEIFWPQPKMLYLLQTALDPPAYIWGKNAEHFWRHVAICSFWHYKVLDPPPPPPPETFLKIPPNW